MAKQIQLRRGTEAENNAFTGALAELTVDTTNKALRLHDGVTAGGVALVNNATNQTIAGIKTFTSSPVVPTPTTDTQAANKTYVDDKTIGWGQTWQNVTASRSAGVFYTNTTGKPIFIKVNVRNTVNSSSYIDNRPICNHNVKTDFTAIIPDGSTYILGSGVTFYNWSELR
jgi:hypothetical protein